MTQTKKNLDALLMELLEEFRHAHATQTELAAHVRGMIANDLLLVATFTFPTSGVIDLDFPAPYGSVAVDNHSGANTVTVSADTPQDVAPRGRGSHRIAAGKFRVVGLHGKALTLYGTSGEGVSVQVYTRAHAPAGG